MHVQVGYPDESAERHILALARGEALESALPNLAEEIKQSSILEARKQVLKLHMSEAVEEYIVQLILATRKPEKYGSELGKWLEFGASPRATLALDRCSRAHAWLNERDYVSPDDVQAIAHDCLRHRLILSYEAEAEGTTSDDLIDTLLSRVPIA